MPLLSVRSSSSQSLWDACVSRFLDEAAPGTAPSPADADAGATIRHSFLWLAHRVHRDALFRTAAERGRKGWLAPPVAFLSALPKMFDVRGRPVGLLRRRMLLARLAAEAGPRHGLGGFADPRADRGAAYALDRLFGELLPEGVAPGELEAGLEGLDGDEFTRRRNGWVVEVYAGYLGALEDGDRWDPRAIHAIVADRIDDGGLPEAIGGAARLHIYGLHTLHRRRRLMAALRDQEEVDVLVYLAAGSEDGAAGVDAGARSSADASEWDELGVRVEGVAPEGDPAPVRVQPAPDAQRELEWVAGQVKRLVLEGEVPLHEIAVIARNGRADTRRAYEIFRHAGIPAAARIRSPLAEIPALRALLALFRAAADGWGYRPLRTVLESAYFDLDVDLRSIDGIACDRRVRGLDAWAAELARRVEAVESAEREEGGGRGPHPGRLDRLERDRAALDELRRAAAGLDRARSIAGWIDTTRELLDPGWFGFRRSLCDDGGGHWEIVRMDQRGVEALDRLLGEWSAAGPSTDELTVGGWYARLRRFLESNELALSTPRKTGVQILEAHEAVAFPFRHAFVIHANDGEFPRRVAPGAIFTEEERERLAEERGLPLSHRRVALERERALWRAVTAGPAVTSDGAADPDPAITVTYRTANVEGAPLLPSLLVPAHDESLEIPRRRYTWSEPFDSGHAVRTAASELADRKRRGEAAAVRALDGPALRQAIVAGHAESRRRGAPAAGREAGEPGPWNGELRDPWLLAYLADRFGEARVWSASQLELYAKCPFHYLVQRVLWLEEVREAEEETTPLTFGSVAHDLLERFYGSMNGAIPTVLDASARARFDAIADAVFEEAERANRKGEAWLGLPFLWAVTKRDLRAKVAAYLEWELPFLAEKGEEPVDFEVAFGRGSEADPVTIDGLDVRGDRASLRLAGRIDRVDRVGSDGAMAVLDYKSGKPPTKGGYSDGAILQAPLYMRALARLRGADVERGRYRSIKFPGDPQNGALVKWGDGNFERALAIALSIPARIRAGKFEAKMAKAGKWNDWLPGLDICRTDAKYREGSRFDE